MLGSERVSNFGYFRISNTYTVHLYNADIFIKSKNEKTLIILFLVLLAAVHVTLNMKYEVTIKLNTKAGVNPQEPPESSTRDVLALEKKNRTSERFK
jgi:hypothetical protein